MKKPGLVAQTIGWLAQKSGAPFPFNIVGAIGGGLSQDKLNQPFKKSVWVRRAIQHVSGPVASVSLVITKKNRINGKPENDSRIIELLQAPAIGMSHSDFKEASVGWLKLAGEFFLLLGDDAMVPFPEVMPSFPKAILARPDRMRHVMKDGILVGWEYTDGKGGKHILLPEQVIHQKNWNPYDEFRGLGDLEAAQLAAESDYLAGRFTLSLMRNQGSKGEYIIAKNGVPDDAQRQQIIQQLRAKREAMARGEFKPMFITGDITVEDGKVATPDAAFQSLRIENRHEIFMAFGVPASFAQVTASYSVGSASDRFRLIEETCMPVGAKVCEALSTLGTRRAGYPVFVELNWDENSTMQQVRRERLAQVDTLWSKGMPMEKINEYLQLRMPEFDGWDTGYLPFSVSRVSDLLNPADDSSYSETPDSGSTTEDAAGKVLRILTCARTKAKERPAKEIQLWRSHMARRKTLVKAYEAAFRKVLMKARAEVLKKLGERDQETEGKALTRAAAADFLFNLAEFTDVFRAAMRKTGTVGLQQAGKELFAEIGKDDPFTLTQEEVLNALRGRENKLSGVPDEIYGQVKNSLEEGIDGGETMSELADRVRGEFNGIGKERATRIAMTETTAVYSEGRDIAMKQAGVAKKRWLTSGNSNVRAAHADANGQTVEIDEPFDVGGEELMFPGDENGSPENVINCHCVSIPILNEDDTEEEQ